MVCRDNLKKKKKPLREKFVGSKQQNTMLRDTVLRVTQR